jgi:hypothetical protein
MEELFSIVGLFASCAALTIWSGYVLTLLWRWFMLPIFHLPTLGLPQAIGLSAIVALLTQRSSYREKKLEGVHLRAAIYNSFLHGLVILFIGWVAKRFS